MPKYIVEFNIEECIGCGACAAVAEEFFEINNDGKSNLKKGKKRKDGWQELDIDEKDLETYKEVAETCPVSVIHITNKETKEEII